jgi:hypothetical protein
MRRGIGWCFPRGHGDAEHLGELHGEVVTDGTTSVRDVPYVRLRLPDEPRDVRRAVLALEICHRDVAGRAYHRRPHDGLRVRFVEAV